jgi:hypothetical protein
MKASEVLWELEEILSNRGDDYGTPEENFQRIANVWSDWLGITIDSKDVGVMLILLKIARLRNRPDHYDSLIDIAGYAVATIEAANLKPKPEKD